MSFFKWPYIMTTADIHWYYIEYTYQLDWTAIEHNKQQQTDDIIDNRIVNLGLFFICVCIWVTLKVTSSTSIVFHNNNINSCINMSTYSNNKERERERELDRGIARMRYMHLSKGR